MGIEVHAFIAPGAGETGDSCKRLRRVLPVKIDCHGDCLFAQSRGWRLLPNRPNQRANKLELNYTTLWKSSPRSLHRRALHRASESNKGYKLRPERADEVVANLSPKSILYRCSTRNGYAAAGSYGNRADHTCERGSRLFLP